MAKGTCEIWPRSMNVLKKSENAKDEEGSQAKNKAVDTTKNESFYYEVYKTVPKNFPDSCA